MNKKNSVLITAVFLSGFLLPQILPAQKNFVRDAERIFSAEETARLDSFLTAVNARTGHYIIITTDTADISSGDYTERIARSFVPDTARRVFIFQLLFSRHHSLVFVSANRHLKAHLTEQQILELLEVGVPWLREKKPGLAAWTIADKMNDWLELLSRQQTN